MNLERILDRISEKAGQLGLSDSQLSLQAGSKEVIRNWRRAVRRGESISPKHENLAAIAAAIGVTSDWLINGTGGDAALIPGLAEGTTSYTPQAFPADKSDPQGLMRMVFGPAVQTPATYKLGVGLPGFGLAAGDVLIMDMARLPDPGELALIRVYDDADGSSSTIRRFLPPYLAAGLAPDDGPVMRIDQPGVTVLYPVIGSIRGLN